MKILSVFLVLVFVKTQTDLWIYALILALSVFVGQSVVWFALSNMSHGGGLLGLI